MKWLLLSTFILTNLLMADHTIFNAAAGRGNIVINSSNNAKIISLFREISRLAQPTSDPQADTTCGYIFSGDPNKFGCKGTGRAAADVAAACAGGGQLACTGSGSGRTCTCAFD